MRSPANACDSCGYRRRRLDFKRAWSQPRPAEQWSTQATKTASHERQVTLHVYTFAGVGGRTNSISSSLNLGLTTPVEVSGREFSFNDGGVFQSRPLECTRGDEPQCVLGSQFLGVPSGPTAGTRVLNELRRRSRPGHARSRERIAIIADAFIKPIGCGSRPM